MLTQIKKYLIIKKGFKALVFSACKKAIAFSCVAGLVMITNIPLVSAYEAHTVNVTAKIINNIPKIYPPGGEFCVASEFLVELNVSLDGADIYYTTNGDDPVCNGNKYTVPFSLPDSSDGNVTVKAVACHFVMRNMEEVLIQSAIMEKEFNNLSPNVNVAINDYEYKSSRNMPVWYCNSTYRVDWEVGNYRQGSVADIVYIVDKDNNEVISAGDDVHPIDQDLPTGEMGNYLLKIDSAKGYCYLGYAWVKIIVTEPNGCGDFGISEIIYEPIPPVDNSCGSSAPAPASDNILAVPEPEPIIEDNDNSSGVSDNADDTNDISDDNSSDNGDLDSEDTNEDDVPEEDVEEDEIGEEIKDEDSEDDADEIAEDDNNDDNNLNENEEDIINNEEDIQEDEGIVIDREDDEDEDEEDESDNDIAEDNANDILDDTIENDEESNDNDIPDDLDNDSIGDDSIGDDSDGDDSDENDDGISVDELPITPDDDSTIIEISI